MMVKNGSQERANFAAPAASVTPMERAASATPAERAADQTARTVSYLVMDPSGNVTLLVETPVDVEAQAEVAAALMALEPAAEQVGFLSDCPGAQVSDAQAGGAAAGAQASGAQAGRAQASIALRMAGGEFCGNATMCAAAYDTARTGLQSGTVVVEASGVNEPVPVDVQRLADGSWRGSLRMPAPLRMTTVESDRYGKVPLIEFEGIAHVVLEREDASEQGASGHGELSSEERAAAEGLAPDWCDALGVEGLGLLFFDRAASRMTPLVYIPDAGTLCWENACGSGTSAVGAYLAAERGEPVTLDLHQPGGTLTVAATPDGAITLTGTVTCLAHHTAKV